jgi:GH15 family glucan-1,4-alpha-glucosidase
VSKRIEDYALIGDCHTAALVARDGSIDWLCLPRFDGGACFAALLGTPENGYWQIAPAEEPRSATRRYRDETLILETEFETSTGRARVVDFMPLRHEYPDLVRIVEGLEGQVAMQMRMVLRTDYGSIVPWVRQIDRGINAVAGPDSLRLETPIHLRGEDLTTLGNFTVDAGQQTPFVLTWYASHIKPPPSLDAFQALKRTERWWHRWAHRCMYDGPHREAVVRSLVTLKALTYEPTGGIVAAATTSLPERIGGVRNWDYRYCWVRDATLTLEALLTNGYIDEAHAWREWLLRAVAGNPSQMNIMYGLAGERRLTEIELDWLAGYADSKPVRIGNAAHRQFQLDVFGELIDAMHTARAAGHECDENAWRVETKLAEFLETGWKEPDEGIWEVRGPRRHFTHSKVMAWVAFDRLIKDAEQFGFEGPVERWRSVRDEIHKEVCKKGFDKKRNTFVQSYGAPDLDASLLMIPLVGFLPVSDPRVAGTVEAIEKELLIDGFVARYRPKKSVDGLPPGEGAFLACTFWLADNYALLGRRGDAEQLFARLLELRNDVGLLAEEYDPHEQRQVGNFPQAFAHVGLINTAWNLGNGCPHRRQHK